MNAPLNSDIIGPEDLCRVCGIPISCCELCEPCGDAPKFDLADIERSGGWMIQDGRHVE